MQSDPDRIAVGVVGVGGMGTVHAENLHALNPGVQVVAVMDADPARAEEVAARCGSVSVFGDAHEMIADDKVEAVVIASPDYTHAELTLECLRRKKPVLCEKPLATTAEDALEVVEAEVGVGRKLVKVGFMRRYDPQHLGVRDAVTRGDVGRPVLLKGWHRNPETLPGATSEFVVFSSAIHDLDSARWLLEQEIEEVYAHGVNTEPALGKNTRDLQLIQLVLSGGCLATIEVYVTAGYGYEVGAEVVGERGTAHTVPAGGVVVRRDRALSRPIEGNWRARFQTAYVNEIEQWTKALINGRAEGPDAWDGLMSVLAAEACVASLRSGLPQRLQAPERPVLYRQGLSEVEG